MTTHTMLIVWWCHENESIHLPVGGWTVGVDVKFRPASKEKFKRPHTQMYAHASSLYCKYKCYALNVQYIEDNAHFQLKFSHGSHVRVLTQ